MKNLTWKEFGIISLIVIFLSWFCYLHIARAGSVSILGSYTDDVDTAQGSDVSTDFNTLAAELNRVNSLGWTVEIQSVRGDDTNPPDEEMVGDNNTLLFDPTVNETVRFGFRIPPEASTTSLINIAVIYSGDGTAANNVILAMNYRVTTTDENTGTGGNSGSDTVTLAMSATEDLQKVTSSDLQVPASAIASTGEWVSIELYRNATDAGDTYAGDFKIIAIIITGTKS